MRPPRGRELRFFTHGGSNSGLRLATRIDVNSFTKILAEKRRRIARRRLKIARLPVDSGLVDRYIAFVTHSVVTFLL
jgi:hypothetical protein